jgi:hypothetical protein
MSAGAFYRVRKFMNNKLNIKVRATVVVKEVKEKSRFAGIHYEAAGC